MERSVKKLILLIVSVAFFAGCGADASVTSASAAEVRQVEIVGEAEKKDLLYRFSEANAMIVEDGTILIENVSPYGGRYLEADAEETVEDVYAFRITNLGTQTIQDAELVFSTEQQELVFYVEMLPVGQTVTAVELHKTPVAEQTVYYVESSITYLDSNLENSGCIEVVDSKDGYVTIKNAAQEWLPLVRVFYRTADEEGNLLGGRCMSFIIDGMEPDAEIKMDAEDWCRDSQISTVLLVQE